MARCRLPTVAAVNGAAVGAGMNLALACDVRLAARRARFDTRFLQIGLHPGGGHTWMLRRLAGPQTAMAAVVFGEVFFDGTEAERVGVVWRCVDDDEKPGAAHALAVGAAGVPVKLAMPAEGDDHGDGRSRRARRGGAPRSLGAAAVEHPASPGSPSASLRCRRRSRLARRLDGEAVGVALSPVAAMKWGVSLAQAGELADPTTVADVAKQAEDAGWDGVFVWDHLWHRTGLPLADPWVTLAAIAAATQRVTIGTLVCALPRRRPQLVAQAATTLDRLSGARMVLGLGLGVDSYGEFSTFGEPAATTVDAARRSTQESSCSCRCSPATPSPPPAGG